MATERTKKQISTTVTPEVHAGLQEFRFTNRIEKLGDVVAQAMTEFLANHNIAGAVEAEGTDAPADGNTKGK